MGEATQPTKRQQPVEQPQIRVEQNVGTVADGQVTAVSIGQMRDAIIQIQQRALTMEEAAQHAADIERELLAQGVRGLTQRLAAQVAAAPASDAPYKGLPAYDLGDADRFYGRVTATAALLAALSRGRLAVLHAESGVGKSSLLQAGIAARLIEAGHLAVYLRPYRTQPLITIKEAFLELGRAPRLAGLPLRDFLRDVTDILGPGKTLYLLVDQFEEFFAYLEPSDRAAFAVELGVCLHDESLNVRWAIALRGEALSRLAEMEAAGVEPFENQYRLARLTREEAKEAITGPGFAFEPNLVETILDDLTKNGEVAPPQLQLVCLALTDGRMPPAAIGRNRYDELGGTEGILRDYLVRQVQAFPREEREPVRRLLRDLVTADGRRAVLAYGDLAKVWEAKDRAGNLLDTLLARLVERRLLVAQERSSDGEHLYELAHDTLLQEIHLDPAEQARKAVQEMLDRSVLDYRANPRMLLDDDKFDAINARRGELIMGHEALELLRKSEAMIRRRRTLVRGGMAVVSVLAMIAVVLTTAIIGAQQQLGQMRNEIATQVAERVIVGTEAAHGRATQAAVIATSKAVSAAGTVVAVEATKAAFRLQAQVSFGFDDYTEVPGIPGRPILTEDAQLEIAIGDEPAQPIRLDRWTKIHTLDKPATTLTSRVQTVVTQTQRTVDGRTLTQINFFRDFTGELSRYADPALWRGLTVEAIFQATSRDDWLRASIDLVKPAEFDAFYGMNPAVRSELEEYSDYRVRPVWPCTLEIYVSGAKVATLNGYLAAVWEHDEDVRGLYVARFVSSAGK